MERQGDLLGAFFLTYALCQIPFGVLADRFGPRRVLTFSIAAWSAVTALTGFVDSFAGLIAIRLLLGASESGAYPAAAKLVKQWAGPTERGRYNSVITLGGRLGGAASPWLTTALVAALASAAVLARPADTSGVAWRGVFVLYGVCGLTVAALFWLLVRDRPPGVTAPPEPPTESAARQILLLVRSVIRLTTFRQMWYFGLVQLGLSLGWTFLITLLPRYLSERFAVGLEARGRMQSAILITGCVGMVAGGLTADRMRRASARVTAGRCRSRPRRWAAPSRSSSCRGCRTPGPWSPPWRAWRSWSISACPRSGRTRRTWGGRTRGPRSAGATWSATWAPGSRRRCSSP